jgi:DNA-directed RNA polymerase subunit RPC12/RpoP
VSVKTPHYFLTAFEICRTVADLESYIRNHLKPHLIVGTVDWSRFSGLSTKLGELQDFAISRDGQLLSKSYLGSHEKHLWRCNKCKTEWWAVAKDVVGKNSWCPSCARNKKHTLDEIRDMVSARGFTVLSSEYRNMYTKLIFRCNKCNHKWLAKPNSIQQGTGCPWCYRNRSSKCQ